MAATERMKATPKRAQAGFNLLEILVSLLVLMLGLLGLVGLQATAQQAEVESYQRAQAMVLMNDIVDRLNTNRKGGPCYNITASSGVKYVGTATYLGAADSDHYDTSSAVNCPSVATNPNAQNRASLDLQLIDEMMQGVTETRGGASVGSMIGARACIGFDTNSQAYTVAVAWQGLSKTFSPYSWPSATNPAVAHNCAKDKFGDDAQRRVVWTTLLVASLN